MLTLYCPFLHHVANPLGGRSANAYACGSKCVEAAVQAVQTAEALNGRGMLNEAYALTVDVLVVAATTLLAAQLGDPEDGSFLMMRSTSRTAKTLLEGLAKRNSAAAQCLESLRASTLLNSTYEKVDETLTVYPKSATD